MPVNMQPKDIRTLAYVLRRTNYGEADRILNIITPQGKMSVIAKGVRREKSKLAGGIEMFSRVELNIHQGKSEFGIVTSAKMLQFFNNILKDFSKTEFAADILKRVSKMAEGSDNPEYYDVVDQAMVALDAGVNFDLIRIWVLFNLKKASGEEINLYRDINGAELDADKKYEWDFYEKSLVEKTGGDISADKIKLMRLLVTNDLMVVSRVKSIDDMMSSILKIAEAV